MHPVPLSRETLMVLDAQHDMHEDGATQEANDQISQDDSMTGPEPGRFAGDVNIGTDHTVEITPADDDSNHHTSLVHSLDVVGTPRECIGDRRVNADRTEERSGVLDARSVRRDQHDEPDDGAGDDCHVTVPAPTGAVGKPADENRH